MSRIIKDNEIEKFEEENDDHLWTSAYVETLYELIETLDSKDIEKWFNIWLYGARWSWKSSIIHNVVKEKLNKEKYHVVEFDCRKYSKDDLRRSILLKTVEELYNNDTNTIKIIYNIMYSARELSETGEMFDIDKILKILKKYKLLRIIPCIVLGIYFIALFICRRNRPEYFISCVQVWWWISGVIFFIANTRLSFLSFIWKKNISEHLESISLNQVSSIIPKIEITHSIYHEKLFSWEQFEYFFSTLIWKKDKIHLLGISEDEKNTFKSINLNGKKIVFVFDNIDRCDKETTKEILMTIKTFLNQPNCIFLIPIDYEAVCKYYDSDQDWDEYLRKIFNIGIHIKKPHNTHIKEIVIKLLEKHNWIKEFWITQNDINNIWYILGQWFANNPRKIKQFLNNLWLEYALIRKDNPNPENNILSVMKYLLFKQELPKLFEEIIYNPSNYWEICQKYFEDKEQDPHPLFVNTSTILVDWNIMNRLLSKHTFEYLKIEELAQKNWYKELSEIIIKPEFQKEIINYIDSALSWYISHPSDIQFIQLTRLYSLCISHFENIPEISNKNLSHELQLSICKNFLTLVNENDIKDYLDDKKIVGVISTSKENEQTLEKHLLEFVKKAETFESLDDQIINFVKKHENFLGVRKGIIEKFGNTTASLKIIIEALWISELDHDELTEEKFNKFDTELRSYISQWINHRNSQFEQLIQSYVPIFRVCLMSQIELKRMKELLSSIFTLINYNYPHKKDFVDILYANLKDRVDTDWRNNPEHVHNILSYYSSHTVDMMPLVCLMIQKTHNNQEQKRSWLTDEQLKQIIWWLSYTESHVPIVQILWENSLSKGLLLSFWEQRNFNEIEKYIDFINNQLIIKENDWKEIWWIIEKKLLSEIRKNTTSDLLNVCDFINSYSTLFDYVDKKTIKNAIKNTYKAIEKENPATITKEDENLISDTIKKIK